MGNWETKWKGNKEIYGSGLIQEAAKEVSKHNLSWKSLPSVTWDADLVRLDPNESATEDLPWTKYIYYVIDWYEYSWYSDDDEYNPSNGIPYYFNKMRAVSCPAAKLGALELIGKTWPEKWDISKRASWVDKNVEFADYDIQARAKKGSKAAAANPGLKFLIGVNKKALEALPDRAVTLNRTELALGEGVVVQIGQYKKDFNKIIELLEFMDKHQQESETPFEVKIPKSPNLDIQYEIKRIKEFISELDRLISGTKKTKWNVPRARRKSNNIIEIGVTQAWTVAYVREYCAKRKFKKGVKSHGGSISIGRLGKILDSRILLSPQTKVNKFMQSATAQRPRTIAYLALLHGRNSINGGLSSPVFESFVSKGRKHFRTFGGRFSISDFHKKYTYGDGEIGNVTIEYVKGDPKTTKKKIDKKLKKLGPMATQKQRLEAKAPANDRSWQESYVEFRDKYYEYIGDPYIAILPEKVDRLRLHNWPNTFDDVYSEVLNNTDMQSLTKELLRCINPYDWIEIACRMAIDNIGLDAVFDGLRDSEMLEDLLESSEEMKDILQSIETEKTLQASEMNALKRERDQYSADLDDLKAQRATINKKMDEATAHDSQDALLRLRAQKKKIDEQIEKQRGRMSSVALDQWVTEYNASVGTHMPLSQDENAKLQQQANDFSNAILAIKDPRLKEKLCKNIIEYSVVAAEFLKDVFSGKKFADDHDPEREQKRLTSEEKEDKPVDNINNRFVELLRELGANMLAGILLHTVKKLLNELVEACLSAKSDAWDSINDMEDPKNKRGRKADFTDLLADTPYNAARDLANSLAGFNTADPADIESLVNLMEDLEGLLTQAELCALLKGNPPQEIITIVRNLLQVRYPGLYNKLKGKANTLAPNKIIDFFKQFESHIEADYCEELGDTDFSTQLYQECKPVPNVLSVRESLLQGHATDKQIEDLIRKAKIERLERIKELICLATNEDPVKNCLGYKDPADRPCDDPHAMPLDVYPKDVQINMLMNQMIAAVDPAFKSDLQSFLGRLLKKGESPWQSKAFETGASKAMKSAWGSRDSWWSSDSFSSAGPAKLIAKQIKDDYDAEGTLILEPVRSSLFTQYTHSPETVLVDKVHENVYKFDSEGIKLSYKLSWGSEKDAIIIAEYNVGEWNSGPLSYSLQDGVLQSSPNHIVKWMLESAKTQLAPPNAGGGALIGNSILPLLGSLDTIELINTPSDLPSPLQTALVSQFGEAMKTKWPGEFNETSVKEIKNLFNTITPDMIDEISEGIANSVVWNGVEGFLYGNPDKYDFEAKRVYTKKFLEKLFQTIMKVTHPGDIMCDPKRDSSVLSVQGIKEYIAQRKKELACKDNKKPIFQKEPSNNARAMSEGLVLMLARLYAFEASLRLLPMSTSFRIDTALKSDVLVDILVDTIIIDLAKVDRASVRKTSQSVHETEYEPKSGELEVGFSNGMHVHVENPPVPARPAKDGITFIPKFHYHIIHAANEIVNSRSRSGALIDPYTKEAVLPADDPYSTRGLKFLLKEQLVFVADYYDIRLREEYEIPLEEFSIWMLQQFEHKSFWWHDAKQETQGSNIANFFDLMPRYINDSFVAPRLAQTIFTDGNFIIEPYIYVRQHTPITLEYDLTSLTEEEKTKLKNKVYLDTIAYYQKSPDQVPLGGGGLGEDFWIITKAQENANKFAQEGQLPDELKIVEFPEEFGDLYQGAKININEWRKIVGTTSFLFQLRGTNQEDAPHTNYFEQWQYGMRLNYVFPFGNEVNVNNFPTVDEATIKQEKTYKLQEEDQNGKVIYSVPIIDVQLPVGLASPQTIDFFGTPLPMPSTVPLSYFTYQEIYDDFPRNAFYSMMVKSPTFEMFFKTLFPLEQKLTLVSLNLFMQSLGMDEYMAFDRRGLFHNTKSILRSRYYSILNAHNHDYVSHNVSPKEAMEEGCADDDYWCKMREEMGIGSPPNYARILALTPISVLQSLVTIMDPTWRHLPWTYPGIIAYILSKIDSDPWFVHKMGAHGGAGGGAGQPKNNLLDCPDQNKDATSKHAFSQNEIKLLGVMKYADIPEEDQNFILFTKWPFEYDAAANELKYATFRDTNLFKAMVETPLDQVPEKVVPVLDKLKELVDVFRQVNTFSIGLKKNLDEIVDIMKDNDYYTGIPDNAVIFPDQDMSSLRVFKPNSGWEKQIRIDCEYGEYYGDYEGFGIANNKKRACTQKLQLEAAIKQYDGLTKIIKVILDYEPEEYSTEAIEEAIINSVTKGEDSVFDLQVAGQPTPWLAAPAQLNENWHTLPPSRQQSLLSEAIRNLSWNPTVYKSQSDGGLEISAKPWRSAAGNPGFWYEKMVAQMQSTDGWTPIYDNYQTGYGRNALRTKDRILDPRNLSDADAIASYWLEKVSDQETTLAEATGPGAVSKYDVATWKHYKWSTNFIYADLNSQKMPDWATEFGEYDPESAKKITWSTTNTVVKGFLAYDAKWTPLAPPVFPEQLYPAGNKYVDLPHNPISALSCEHADNWVLPPQHKNLEEHLYRIFYDRHIALYPPRQRDGVKVLVPNRQQLARVGFPRLIPSLTYLDKAMWYYPEFFISIFEYIRKMHGIRYGTNINLYGENGERPWAKVTYGDQPGGSPYHDSSKYIAKFYRRWVCLPKTSELPVNVVNKTPGDNSEAWSDFTDEEKTKFVYFAGDGIAANGIMQVVSTIETGHAYYDSWKWGWPGKTFDEAYPYSEKNESIIDLI